MLKLKLQTCQYFSHVNIYLDLKYIFLNLENFKFSGGAGPLRLQGPGQQTLLLCSPTGAGYGNSCSCAVEIFPSFVIYLRPETHPNDRKRNSEIVSSRQSESPRRLVVPVKFDFLAHDAVLLPNSLVVFSNLQGTYTHLLKRHVCLKNVWVNSSVRRFA